MHIFHQWTKWEEYDQPMLVWLGGKLNKSIEKWQKRSCIKCGYTQREQIIGF